MSVSKANVNVPTDFKTKEKDVNAKLQLYGIYSAFANGKVPSNKQIDVAMNSALAWNKMSTPSKKLSAEGQKLVADLRDVVEQAKILLLSKNHGNVLQDFIWQTQQISGGNASTPNAPLDKDTAKQHGQQTLEGLRTLGTLIISNGQFRKLLKDATVLIRDIAGDAAQKAANKVNPSQDELSQIDQPADDNTWHDVPDMSRDNIMGQAKSKMPFGKKDLKDAAGDASATAHPSGERDPEAAARLAAEDQQRGTDSGVDAQQGGRAALNTLKDRADQNIPDDKKDQANEYKDRTANYFKNKMPQERREQTIWRLKKMIAEIQGHQDYQQAIDTLLRLAEEYTGHAKNVAGQSVGTVKDAHGDSALQQSETDLKTIIERFANCSSLDDLFDSINQIYRDADRDPELKGWFQRLDKYVRRCLQEQGYVLQDASTDEWNNIYDKGNYLLRDRYRSHTDRIVDELKYYGDQFDKDHQNKAFGNAMNKLFLDLGNDENGKPAFKPHLIKDLTEVIIPGFFENIRYVPIPRIEYSDPMIDCIVENLVLEGDNLAPNLLEFGSDNFWRWGRKTFASKNKNKVLLTVSGIQCDLRDVSYYIKKKQGFPEITDKGVMDVILAGEGLGFKVVMETADPSDKHNFFKVNTVKVHLKGMNIILKQSNHKLLFKIFKPLLLKVMTPVLQKVIEKQVRNNIHQLDGIAYQINQEAKRAQRQVKNDPESAPNVYSRYADAFKNYMTQAKQKKDEVASDKKVNIAITQHDSILSNIKLPGGISTKATEYKELAAKGDKWESPIFSIGSAKETSSLPKPSEITRRNGAGSSMTRDGGAGYGSGNSNSGLNSGVAGAGLGGAGLAGSGLAGSGNQGALGSSGLGSSGLGSSGLDNNGVGNTGVGSNAAGTSGFSSQVDQAFGADKNHAATHLASETTGAQHNPGANTTLGSHNPVFTGQA